MLIADLKYAGEAVGSFTEDPGEDGFGTLVADIF